MKKTIVLVALLWGANFLGTVGVTPGAMFSRAEREMNRLAGVAR